MTLSGKIVTGASILLVAIVGGLACAVTLSLAYDEKHPLACISEQKLVNTNRSTLTFGNGQVLDKSQLAYDGALKIGETYCVAFARR